MTDTHHGAGQASLVSAERVGSVIGVTGRTVRRWARAGSIPSVRCGPRTIRFDPEAIGAWAAEHANEVEEAR
jgi:excisionase family DNA binding protein